MSDGMLLGIDEGTTGVKAALFDQRLQPVAEARRDKVNRHPEEGWVEQDGEEVIAAVTESVAELLAEPMARSPPAGSTTRVSRSWPGTRRRASRSARSSSGRTSAPRRSSTSSPSREDEVKELSGLPFDPYFSAAKLAWLLRHNDEVKKARDDGRLRMGTVDSFLCDRFGAGFATEPATASRTQLQRIDSPGLSTSASARSSIFPLTCCRRSATRPESSAR